MWIVGAACGVRNAECGVMNACCGVPISDCGVRNANDCGVLEC